MEDFREGPFRLDVHALGVYGGVAGVSVPPTLAEAATAEDTSNRGESTALQRALQPLVRLVFSEVARRRALTRKLLAERYGCSTALAGQVKARLAGQRLKRARGLSAAAAAVEGLKQLARDIVAAALAFPLRLLFRAARAVARARSAKAAKAQST